MLIFLAELAAGEGSHLNNPHDEVITLAYYRSPFSQGFGSTQTARLSSLDTSYPEIPLEELTTPNHSQTNYLEAGFPIKVFQSGSAPTSAGQVYTVVGNLDEDPQLEIIVTGQGTGYVHAFKPDGTPVAGWPVLTEDKNDLVNYPALGELQRESLGREVFIASSDGRLAVYDRAGNLLPGWPVLLPTEVQSAPVLADVNRDGRSEIFVGGTDGKLYGLNAEGGFLTGWPVDVSSYGVTSPHTPVVTDLNNNGDLELIFSSEQSPQGSYIFAYQADGQEIFSFSFEGYTGNYPAAADVDGDGEKDIILLNKNSGKGVISILNRQGVVKDEAGINGTITHTSIPALGDLNGDGTPEIIVQSDSALNVIDGYGNSFLRFPREWGYADMGNSAPVIGDVNGDGSPEIVVTLLKYGATMPEVRVYQADGTLAHGFPIRLPLGRSGVPAIADLNQDGFMNIILPSTLYNGTAGYYDKVWVLDLEAVNQE